MTIALVTTNHNKQLKLMKLINYSVRFTAIAAIAFIVLASKANAQILTAGALTGDSDILNDGTTVLAFSVNYLVNGGGPETVNGVSFSSTGDESASGGVILSSSAIDSTAPSGQTASGFSAALTDVDATVGFNQEGNSASLTFSNLQVGHAYQIQILAGGVGDPGSENFSDGFGPQSVVTLTYGPGEANYVVDAFTALSTSETVYLTPQTGNIPLAEYNAVNVRDLGVVPEPSSTALMVLGAGGLFLMIIRRRQQSQV